MSNIPWPWAIVLCRFNDRPNETQTPEYYRDLYTRNGAGGLADYWRAVTMNAFDLTGSQVFGWFEMSHSSAEVGQLHFPGDRDTLIQWGKDAAAANGVSLGGFGKVLVVQNYGVDHGAAGNGVLIVDQDPALCEFGFISHEMGHGFGLNHSYSANPDAEYGDGWDLMSFATTTFQFPIRFKSAAGAATVGLNAWNLERLNAVPTGRTWSPAAPDFSEHVTLDALNQPPSGNNGSLVVKIAPNATQPARANGSSYTVEFRRPAGWDRHIPEEAVLIHEVRTNGYCYLQPKVWGRFTDGRNAVTAEGRLFITPDPAVFVYVDNIDSSLGVAGLRIWDIPDGSLRREDSEPNVYLIEGGQKRWVTTPQVLAKLGRAWNDVRLVPDGGLAGVPDGPDLTIAPEATVPDVIESSEAGASAAVIAAGLRPRFTGQHGPTAWVRTQSPAASHRVPSGSYVTMQLTTLPRP